MVSPAGIPHRAATRRGLRSEQLSDPTERHIPVLDGVRGIAILLVLCLHLWRLLPEEPSLRIDDGVDTLAAGALVAIAWRQPRTFAQYRRPALIVAIAAIVIVAGDTIWAGGLDALDRRTQEVTFTTLALGFAACLTVILSSPIDWLPQRVCSHPILTFFGRYSYGLYVIHLPIATQLAPRVRDHNLMFSVAGSEIPAHVVFALVVGGISVAAAWIVWHLYEQPFLRLKRYFHDSGDRQASAHHSSASATVSP